MDIDINQYLSIFVEESKEHLQLMNDVMLELEKNPDDLDHVNEIFRVAHTLKGMSGTMGFQNMATLTHQMENLLQAVRSHEKDLTNDIVDILFECFDELEAYVEHIVEEGVEQDSINKELLAKIEKSLNGEVAVEKNETKEEVKAEPKKSGLVVDEYVLDLVQKAKSESLNIYEIKFVLEETTMLKAARAFIIFNALEEEGEIIFSEPTTEDIEDEKFDREFSVLYVTVKDQTSLEEILNSISEVEKIVINEYNLPETQAAEKVETKQRAKIEEKVTTKKAEIEIKQETTKEKVVKPKENNGGAPKIAKTVRVDIDRLDNLMNLVSELIIIKTRMDGIAIENQVKNSMTETIEYLDRITSNLHDAVMKVRMVPIERVFNRFPRLVRDLSRDLNKDIKLEMSGEETEVDRTIIDEIGDPLIHLIRNSLDHGIELPEKRVALGKSAEGTVILKAYPDGNNVVIEVADDGAGINTEIIKAKAIEKGIATEEEIRYMNDEDAVMLLFRAGFSTADTISDVSGRGVGLDVVKSKIESINGSIEVDTKMGKGSKFIIRIPLTLAIIQALMVKLGDEIYAIPLNSVTEITTIEKQLINKVQGQEVVVFRENTIPVVRLGKILGVSDTREEESDEYLVVIVNKGEKQAGIIVDELIVQQEIVIKSLGSYLNTIKHMSGATILGDGSISLIVDVNSLI